MKKTFATGLLTFIAMSTYKCPKGHESSEPDYCSECGAKINGTLELSVTTTRDSLAQSPTAATVLYCPDCTAPHEADSGNFCEICGYNFVTGAHGEVPPVPITPMPAAEITNQVSARTAVSEPLIPNSAPAGTVEKTELEVVVTIDPSLREPESPPPPTNQAPITVRLDKQSHLIGRRSEVRAIHPEVALNFDDAVSHRHALLNRQPDGTYILRDIGSTNGTKLNGVELAAMVDTPIKEGDELTLGHWTRLSIKVVQEPSGESK